MRKPGEMQNLKMRDEYYDIFSGAALAGLASLFHSLNIGMKGASVVWRMAEASLMGACVAAMLHFRYGWPVYLTSTLCIIVGFVAQRAITKFQSVTDAIADRAIKEIGDGVPEKPEDAPESQRNEAGPEIDKKDPA